MSPQSADMDISRTLRLEAGDSCYDEVAPRQKLAVPEARTSIPDGMGSSSSGLDSKDSRKNVLNSIVLGQVLSLLIATISMSAASLDDRGVNLPSFVNFVNYSTIMIVFFLPMVFARGSLQLSLPWWRYALYSLVRPIARFLLRARSVCVSFGSVRESCPLSPEPRSIAVAIRSKSANLRAIVSWLVS